MSTAAISRHEAAQRLAQAVELSTSDDLPQIFTELYPAESLPDVAGAKAAALATQLAARIRQGLQPEEIVDLWNVVFADGPGVYYDEEDDVLRSRDLRLRYAEP